MQEYGIENFGKCRSMQRRAELEGKMLKDDVVCSSCAQEARVLSKMQEWTQWEAGSFRIEKQYL